MTSDVAPEESATLSPDEAFDVLGNETRLQILEALVEAGGPIAYSDLYDRIEYDDTSNFTYHLQKLVGPFVRKTDEGYVPRLAGRRVVEAIFSGVITEMPVVERTETDMACMYCGSQTEMAYYDEVALIYCRECGGRIGNRGPVEEWPVSDTDVVGYVSIPPAGVADRSPTEILEAAGIWTLGDVQVIVRGVCPRCSATVERSVRVCEQHDASDDFCDRCDHQFGVSVYVRCTNCPFQTISPYPTHAVGTVELLSFMTEHGIDPFVSDAFHLRSCTEEIVSVDPLRARYTFTTGGDSLALTVNEDLTVVESTREC